MKRKAGELRESKEHQTGGEFFFLCFYSSALQPQCSVVSHLEMDTRSQKEKAPRDATSFSHTQLELVGNSFLILGEHRNPWSFHLLGVLWFFELTQNPVLMMPEATLRTYRRKHSKWGALSLCKVVPWHQERDESSMLPSVSILLLLGPESKDSYRACSTAREQLSEQWATTRSSRVLVSPGDG